MKAYLRSEPPPPLPLRVVVVEMTPKEAHLLRQVCDFPSHAAEKYSGSPDRVDMANLLYSLGTALRAMEF